MVGLRWVAENWYIVLGAIGIIGGIFFDALARIEETKAIKISNLLSLTGNHREVWKEYDRPELARIEDPTVDLIKKPVTRAESMFVIMVILHTSSGYETLKEELLTKQEGLLWDVGAFFSWPIPTAVWEKTKLFQNRDFVAFVEKCRTSKSDE